MQFSIFKDQFFFVTIKNVYFEARSGMLIKYRESSKLNFQKIIKLYFPHCIQYLVSHYKNPAYIKTQQQWLFDTKNAKGFNRRIAKVDLSIQSTYKMDLSSSIPNLNPLIFSCPFVDFWDPSVQCGFSHKNRITTFPDLLEASATICTYGNKVTLQFPQFLTIEMGSRLFHQHIVKFCFPCHWFSNCFETVGLQLDALKRRVFKTKFRR